MAKRNRRERGTEFHDAFWSLGADKRVNKLSDAEFNRQLVDEVGGLFGKSADHLGKAGNALGELLDGLFELLF